jgi:hypothetical protein
MNGKSHFLVRTVVYLTLVRIGAYLMIAAVIQQAPSSQFANIPSAEQATLSGSNREKAGGGQTVAKETVSAIHPEKSGTTSLQGGRLSPDSPGTDDGPSHDHRHGANGVGPG